jgi:DNA-binding XRE family transcriptional regulator
MIMPPRGIGLNFDRLFPIGYFVLLQAADSSRCYRSGTFRSDGRLSMADVLDREHSGSMNEHDNTLHRRASQAARAFGSLIRRRRQGLRLRQDQLALATGVGRRFLIDLEAGKMSCQLGLSLVVAEALGLRPGDVLATGEAAAPMDLPDLADLPDEDELPDG